jgi:hypothetical protein
MTQNNRLGDIEGAINAHYNQQERGSAANGSASIPVAPVAAPEPVVEEQLNLPIIGGHEDHDHAPIVVNPPYIIIQYGQNEQGEGAFSLNVAGIDGGILGAIGQIEETVAQLKEQIKQGNIATDQ